MSMAIFQSIKSCGLSLKSTEIGEEKGLIFSFEGGTSLSIDEFLFVEKDFKTKVFPLNQVDLALQFLKS